MSDPQETEAWKALRQTTQARIADSIALLEAWDTSDRRVGSLPEEIESQILQKAEAWAIDRINFNDREILRNVTDFRRTSQAHWDNVTPSSLLEMTHTQRQAFADRSVPEEQRADFLSALEELDARKDYLTREYAHHVTEGRIARSEHQTRQPCHAGGSIWVCITAG